MPILIPSALALLSLAGTPSNAPADRGVELIGIGLVVGLDGTGSRSTFTRQMAVDMRQRLAGSGPDRFRQLVSRGMRDRPGPFRWPCEESPESVLRGGNVSAALVVARVGSGATKGERVDVTVSSMDDARSLQGGRLLATVLKAVDGEVYAVAQGPLGGTAPEGTKGATTAVIQHGGLVERSVR
jgi:flagellar P-ring protein precursor FlgI